MIDVGTGSGILAIAAERLGVSQILATDVDEIAVKNAQANIALNPVSHITVKANDLLQGLTVSADLIVATIDSASTVTAKPAWPFFAGRDYCREGRLDSANVAG